MTPEFEQLIDHVNKLQLLLENPQFGLISWCIKYANHMRYISDYWSNN